MWYKFAMYFKEIFLLSQCKLFFFFNVFDFCVLLCCVFQKKLVLNSGIVSPNCFRVLVGKV